MSQVYASYQPDTPLYIPLGSTRIPLADVVFANGVAIDSVNNTFQFADVGSYTADVRLQLSGAGASKSYSVSIYNETLGMAVQTIQSQATKDNNDSDSFLLAIPVVNAAHIFSIKFNVVGGGASRYQMSLYMASVYIATTPLAGYVSGSGTPGTVPKWLGLTLIGDSGITDNGDLVSVYTALYARGSSGFVGVGAAIPFASEKFRVVGDVYFGGDLKAVRGVPYVWPAANAAGKLTNDGAGNLSWAP